MGADQSRGGLPAESQSQLGAGQELGEGAGMDITTLAQNYAEQIAQMRPEEQQMALQALEAQSPQLAGLVQQMLGSMGGGQSDGMQVDMRPLPEQRAPRRESALV